jgi:uncharacterized surface protein with fasciclin (FAS1) repeats
MVFAPDNFAFAKVSARTLEKLLASKRADQDQHLPRRGGPSHPDERRFCSAAQSARDGQSAGYPRWSLDLSRFPAALRGKALVRTTDLGDLDARSPAETAEQRRR